MRLSSQERQTFQKLKTPNQIQDFLDSLHINFEEKVETCSSPRTVLKRKSAHCIEAALLAAAVIIFHKQKPLLLDLKANSHDFDHVVCLFKQNGLWGAISKSNHAALRFREPVYKTVRELAMSYFHEYINDKGEKTLISFSKPYSLASYDSNWVTADYDLWQIANEIDQIKHTDIIPKKNRQKHKLRKADKIEIEAGKLIEWKLPKHNLLKYK